MTGAVIFFLILLLLWKPKYKTPTRVNGIIVSRSEPQVLRENYATCGNCHGTGQSDFGLGASWGGECDCCEGRGSVYLDPNRKTYSFNEFFKMIEDKKAKEKKK